MESSEPPLVSGIGQRFSLSSYAMTDGLRKSTFCGNGTCDQGRFNRQIPLGEWLGRDPVDLSSTVLLTAGRGPLAFSLTICSRCSAISRGRIDGAVKAQTGIVCPFSVNNTIDRGRAAATEDDFSLDRLSECVYTCADQADASFREVVYRAGNRRSRMVTICFLDENRTRRFIDRMR